MIQFIFRIEKYHLISCDLYGLLLHVGFCCLHAYMYYLEIAHFLYLMICLIQCFHSRNYCIKLSFLSYEVVPFKDVNHAPKKSMQIPYGVLFQVGCGADVREHLDRECSGRRTCKLRIPNMVLDSVQSSCPQHFKQYLNVSYDCVPGSSIVQYYKHAYTGIIIIVCYFIGLKNSCFFASLLF